MALHTLSERGLVVSDPRLAFDKPDPEPIVLGNGIIDAIREDKVYEYEPMKEGEWDEIIWELANQPIEDDDIWEEI